MNYIRHIGVLILALMSTALYAQTVSGTVTDENNQPLPGATVVVQGTNTGTTTDFDGNYQISATQGQTLVFSYVGYATQNTVVTNATHSISLQADNTLDEVVVTAFGIQRQAKSLSYATTKVKSEQLTEVSNQNPLESLSGKIAGVDISSPAQPGASTKVIFRGFSSITGSNAPLYVVDGSPILDESRSSNVTTSSFDAGSGVNDLDPNSIESVTFLKGAAATALYGSRGSNGVVLITSKKGVGRESLDGGNLTFEINSYQDFHEVARVPHLQNSFGTGWNGKSFSNVTGEGSKASSNENGSWGAPFNGLIRPWSRVVNNQQLIKSYSALKNNYREFFEIGQTQTNAFTIRNASKNGGYSFTYSRTDADGIVPTDRDSFKKNTFSLNTDTTSNKFKLSTSLNHTHKEQSAVPTGQGDDAAFGKSLMQELIQIPNDLSIVDMKDMSNIFNTPSYFYTPYTTNPYSSLENNNVDIVKDRFFGSFNIGYEDQKGFSSNFQVSTDVDNERVKRWGAIVEYVDGSPQDNASANKVVGGVQEIKYVSRQLDMFLNLMYSRNINNDLNLDFLVGGNYNQRNGDHQSIRVTELVLPDYYEVSNSAETPTLEQSEYLRRVYGWYTQAVFTFKENYFLTLTARNDFSSTLPIKNNSYFYPSASLSAILIDNQDFFGKFRLGWARIGNDTNLYSVFSTAGQASNDAYFGKIDYPFAEVNSNEIFGRIENQNLKPEITDEIELGFEAGLFKNRVNIDFAYYNRKTMDLIVDLPVARSTGYLVQTGNYADLENKGVELALSVKPLVSENFSWTINYTFSKNNSEVTKVNNEEGKVSIYDAFNINFYAEEGKPLGVFYGPKPDLSPNGEIIVDPSTGYYTYDGEEDYLGTSQRDFVMGLRNSFRYKNLNLSFSLDWKEGGKMYSYTKRLSHFTGNGIETTYNNRNPWIIPNSVNKVSKKDEGGNIIKDENGDVIYDYVENTKAVDFDKVTSFYNASQNDAIEGSHVIDKTFIRLRDVSLSYNISSEFISKIGIDAFRITAYGKNLFLWTPGENPYVDPEATSYGRGIRSEFGEFAANPTQRTYGFGVKFKF